MAPLCTTVQLIGHATRGDAYVLDVLLGLDSDDPGRPIALVLARPDTVWFDAAIDRVLRSWADEGRVLNVRLRRSSRKDVAVLEPAGGQSSVRLDLVAVA